MVVIKDSFCDFSIVPDLPAISMVQIQLLVLTTLLALGAAEESKPAEPAAAANRLRLHHLDQDEMRRLDDHDDLRRHHDDHDEKDGRKIKERIVEPFKKQNRAVIEEHLTKDQKKILDWVFSPDYYEPTWIVDYRYLKTGGRDYTRGPGGQILILPKGVKTNEHKEFRDYDALIEFLRLKNLAKNSKEELRGRKEYEKEEEEEEEVDEYKRDERQRSPWEKEVRWA